MIGFMAQDLHIAGYQNVLTLMPNDDLKAQSPGDIDKVQLGVDYSKLTCINAMMIKKTYKEE